MKKILSLFIISICLFFIFSGCAKANINDLVNMVNENPAAYLGDYEELQYISSEYDSEKDGYFLIYQGKNGIDGRNIIHTVQLRAHFFYSEGEWLLHNVETEILSTYLDIAGTVWKTIPKKGWVDWLNVGEDIHILEVAEDSSRICLTYGYEELEFIRENTEDTEFSYLTTNRSEPIAMRYVVHSDGEINICLYLNYTPSMYGEMPDLTYTLAE